MCAIQRNYNTGDAPAPAEPARDAGTPGGREIQAPGKPPGDAPAPVGDLEPAETADIPQLDGADPDLDTLFDPHSGHVFIDYMYSRLGIRPFS